VSSTTYDGRIELTHLQREPKNGKVQILGRGYGIITVILGTEKHTQFNIGKRKLRKLPFAK